MKGERLKSYIFMKMIFGKRYGPAYIARKCKITKATARKHLNALCYGGAARVVMRGRYKLYETNQMGLI